MTGHFILVFIFIFYRYNILFKKIFDSFLKSAYNDFCSMKLFFLQLNFNNLIQAYVVSLVYEKY